MSSVKNKRFRKRSDIHFQRGNSQTNLFFWKRFDYVSSLGAKAFLLNSVPLLHVDTGHNFPETIEFRQIGC
jgi:hypothetical protein